MRTRGRGGVKKAEKSAYVLNGSPLTNLHEKLLEGLPELATHPAVDAEVERIGEADEEVDDQRRRVHELVVEELVDARRHVVQDDNDAHRKLDCQEHLKSQINR